MILLVVIGSAAVAIGCFTIARRTLDTLGNDITNLPLTAAIVVAVVSSGIVISLSTIGIPASFVVIATMSIIGLGWGRATRTTTISDAARGETPVSVGALTAEGEIPEIGEGRGYPERLGPVRSVDDRPCHPHAKRRPDHLDRRAFLTFGSFRSSDSNSDAISSPDSRPTSHCGRRVITHG